jgi:hypothetical protein
MTTKFHCCASSIELKIAPTPAKIALLLSETGSEAAVDARLRRHHGQMARERGGVAEIHPNFP